MEAWTQSHARLGRTIAILPDSLFTEEAEDDCLLNSSEVHPLSSIFFSISAQILGCCS